MNNQDNFFNQNFDVIVTAIVAVMGTTASTRVVDHFWPSRKEQEMTENLVVEKLEKAFNTATDMYETTIEQLQKKIKEQAKEIQRLKNNL